MYRCIPDSIAFVPVEVIVSLFSMALTVRQVWDRRAKNSTFRAVTNAFKRAFSDDNLATVPTFRLATEPEACAHYLARENGVDGLRKVCEPENCSPLSDSLGQVLKIIRERVSWL